MQQTFIQPQYQMLPMHSQQGWMPPGMVPGMPMQPMMGGVPVVSMPSQLPPPPGEDNPPLPPEPPPGEASDDVMDN